MMEIDRQGRHTLEEFDHRRDERCRIGPAFHDSSRGRQSQRQVVSVWERVPVYEDSKCGADILRVRVSRRIDEILRRLANHIWRSAGVHSRCQQRPRSIRQHVLHLYRIQN